MRRFFNLGSLLSSRVNDRMSRRAAPPRALAMVEELEGRTLLSVAVGVRGSNLVIKGDHESNKVTVERGNGPDGTAGTRDDELIVKVEGEADRVFRDPEGKKIRKIVFTGGAGDDCFVNNTDKDSDADGGDGNDTLRGGAGKDTLKGGKGDDILEGRAGDDDLKGELGDDALDGGDGKDKLLGGPDSDSFSPRDESSERKDFSALEGDLIL